MSAPSFPLLREFLAAAAHDPYAILDGPAPDETPGVWLLREVADRIAVDTPMDIPEACQRIENAARDNHVAALIDYELGYWLEPAAALREPLISRPPLLALVFREASWLPRAAFDVQLAQWVAEMAEEQRHAGIADLRYGIKKQSYRAAIQRILAYIRAGDTYQINYTWPMFFQSFGAPLALYAELRKRQPVEHGAFVQLEARSLLSLSPESFLERRGPRLISKPMKGTAPRGQNLAQDQALATSLQNSVKDRAENVMIVDLIRNDMGRLARPGSVKVDALFAVEHYPTVHQMVSTVSADIGNAPLCDILGALFPCGSITGAPKIRAMQIAQELEAEERGLYTGSIGHFRPGGDFSMNVAIRTVELDQDGKGRLGIGGGIVADSQPDLEYRECLNKALFLTALPVHFHLIETILLEPGAEQAYPLLPWHLERLSGSAAYFGFAYEERWVRDALKRLAAEVKGQDAQRVRLTLAQNGHVEVEHNQLDALPVTPTITFSETPIYSGNPLLRHKTTVRSLYDTTLAQLAQRPGYFDALFFNERGELTEGARSTVYLKHGERWRTPALGCGVLNAVMRRVLLQTHQPPIVESVLHREDVVSADEIWLSNALRGFFRVRLVP